MAGPKKLGWFAAASLAIFSLHCLSAEKKSQPGLCKEKENALFSCPTKSGKWISLCEGSTLPRKLEYRFGKVGGAELRLPKDQKGVVSYNSVAYSGGGGGYVRFSNAGTDYIVFSRIRKGYGEDSGVLVRSRAAGPKWIKCSKESDLDLPAIEKLALKKELDDQDPLIDADDLEE